MAIDIDEIPDYVASVTSHFFTFYLKPFKAGAVHKNSLIRARRIFRITCANTQWHQNPNHNEHHPPVIERLAREKKKHILFFLYLI